MDKNEIIRGLEKISDYFFDVYREEANKETYAEAKDRYDVIESTLELLKEQEAVEPIPPTDESDLWKCGNCNHQLFRCTHQRYCEMCGRAVKWK